MITHDGYGYDQFVMRITILIQYLSQILQIRMLSRAIALILCVSLVFSQASPGQSPTALNFSAPIPLELKAQTSKSFTMTIPSKSASVLDLYVNVQSPPNDPFQEPEVEVTAAGNLSISCYESEDQFSGVCRIPKEEALPNRTFTLTVTCNVDCKLTVQAYFSDVIQIPFNGYQELQAPQLIGQGFQFMIKVPADLEFTQISVLCSIQNLQDTDGGMELYLNVGDTSRMPTKESHRFQGRTIYGGGKGVFLSKEQIKQGESLVGYVFLSQRMQIKIHTTAVNGNNASIELGKAYFDFTTINQPKIYTMDLKDEKIDDKTISLSFLLYSGTPKILVSFQDDFKESLTSRTSLGYVKYLLTPAIRASHNYKAQIFIKVESDWVSDFYFASDIQDGNYVILTEGQAELSSIQGTEVMNYFFQEFAWVNKTANEPATKSYTIKIEVDKGTVEFGVRRCLSREVNSTLDCLLLDLSDLTQQVYDTFKEITLQSTVSDAFTYLRFSYDTSKCLDFASYQDFKVYYCSYQIIAASSYKTEVDYSIGMWRRDYSLRLAEGYPVKDVIAKQQSLYYSFELSSLQNIASITVFLTLLEGDVYLLLSTQDPYPSYEDIGQPSIVFTGKNTITLTNPKSTKVYAGVYGIQVSQFTLGVIVGRKSQNKPQQLSAVTLKDDNPIDFTIGSAQSSMQFSFLASKTTQYSLKITQLSAQLSFEITANKSPVTCLNTQTKTDLKCVFQAKESLEYVIKVSGDPKQVRKGVIGIAQAKKCLHYGVGSQLFVELQPAQTECSTYEINDRADLVVVNSASTLALLQRSISFKVCVNKTCMGWEDTHHLSIPSSLMSISCSDKTQSCPITVTYSNKANSSIPFNLIVEKQESQRILLDGVVERIKGEDMSQTVGKFFYYEVDNKDDTIRLICTLRSVGKFYLAAHFVGGTGFALDPNAYLQFRNVEAGEIEAMGNANFYQNVLSRPGTTIIPLRKQDIVRGCPGFSFSASACFLTVSLFSYSQSPIPVLFQLQISQKYAELSLGQSKLGYLQLDEVVIYELEGSSIDSYVEMRQIGGEGAKCWKGILVDDEGRQISLGNGFTLLGNASSPAETGYFLIYLEGKTKSCSYQLTFSTLSTPVVKVEQSTPIPLTLEEGQNAYFLYYHMQNSSFKIDEILMAGQSFLYVRPLGSNYQQSLQETINGKMEEWPFKDDPTDGEFIVSKGNTNFCYQCFYLIGAIGKPNVQSELMILPLNGSIPLSTQGIHKSSLKANSNLTYTFHSLSTFNLSVTMLYGSISVEIYNATKHKVAFGEVDESEIIVVPHPVAGQKIGFQFNSPLLEFKIVITAKEDSKFALEIRRYAIKERIFEGVPGYASLKKGKESTIQFICMTSNPQKDITLIIEVLSSTANDSVAAGLLLGGSLEEISPASKPHNLKVTSVEKSANAFTYTMEQTYATYFLKITPNVDMTISLLLVKSALTHLLPDGDHLFKDEGVFEVFSKESGVVVEMWACTGEYTIQAGKNYSELIASQQSSSILSLEHQNYGNHFMISAPDVYGEYFIKTVKSPSTSSSFNLYHISYYFYGSESLPPHKYISLPSLDVTYNHISQTVTAFALSNLQIASNAPQPLRDGVIKYELFIGKSKSEVDLRSKCEIGVLWSLKFQGHNAGRGKLEFIVDTTQIKGLLGSSSNISTKYYVSARVTLLPSAQEYSPSSISLAYNSLEMTLLPLPPAGASTLQKVLLFLLWIALPFLLAGIMLVLALRFCIRKFYGPTSLVEEHEAEMQAQSADVMSGGRNKVDPKQANNASGAMKEQID